jgi:anti-sigma B factor antagonist
MDLNIETRTKGDIYIIDVQGEVDLYSSTKLREYIFTTIKQQHPKTLIIELSGVRYIDSSGIATLVEGLKLANEYEIQFKLVGLSHIVLEVFELVRLQRVFDIYPTEEDAMGDV